MSLPIPRLDDRTYADLVQEAVAQIPSLAPDWTDHNASDPGVTLLELLAWRAEMLLYRTDQVPPAHVRAFLHLLNGPGWAPDAAAPLDEAVTATILSLRQRVRAVTGADYEALSTEDFSAWRREIVQREKAWTELREKGGTSLQNPLEEWWRTTGLPQAPENHPGALPDVARARCYPRRDLDLPGSGEMPGHLSVVVIPDLDRPCTADEESRVCRAVWGFLDERRLVSTWHHVVPPVHVPVRVRVVAALRGDVPESATPLPLSSPGSSATSHAMGGEMLRTPMTPGMEEVHREFWAHLPADPRQEVCDRVRRFLDPVHGGAAGNGWPLGRSVYLSELYALIEDLPLVEYVPLVVLESACAPGEAPCPAAPLAWNSDGQVIGLRLEGHQLPLLRMEPEDVFLSGSLVPVVVRVELARPRGAYTGPQLGAMRDAIRQAFPPLRPHGPGVAPGAVVEVGMAGVRGELARRTGLPPSEFTVVDARAEASRLGRDRDGAVVVRFREQEMAEVSVDLAGGPEEPETAGVPADPAAAAPEAQEKPS